MFDTTGSDSALSCTLLVFPRTTGTVPSVSIWGLGIFALLVLCVGTMVIARQRVTATYRPSPRGQGPVSGPKQNGTDPLHGVRDRDSLAEISRQRRHCRQQGRVIMFAAPPTVCRFELLDGETDHGCPCTRGER